MKRKSTIARFTFTVLSVFVLASAGLAAPNPLHFPWGLAVDAKGNLYVANTNASNILVFSPGYVLQTADTITQGVSSPTGVAFDPLGNLWVANSGGGNGSITEYSGGVQNTNATITNGILGPVAIAIDGLYNIFVVNDDSYISIYEPTAVFQAPATLVSTTSPSNPIYSVAVGQGTLSWGSNGQTLFRGETGYLLNNDSTQNGMPGTALALTSDALGNVYAANNNMTVSVNSPQYGGTFNPTFLTLSFQPYGIGIDNARGRVSLSDPFGNAIWVYSTAGKFLKTIK
jgi:hypothetical protein